jgi:N-acetylglutamate synthase-like GNAT family acetyltransferase
MPRVILKSVDNLEIRQATRGDNDAIVQLDGAVLGQPLRSAFISRAVEAGQCYVASIGKGSIVGCAALEYTFFEQGYVSLLYVRSDHRRKGVGSRLMRHMESVCRTPKLFTSTNQSNGPMQSLLTKMGYFESGAIENLDEADPELVYVKFLGQDEAAA